MGESGGASVPIPGAGETASASSGSVTVRYFAAARAAAGVDAERHTGTTVAAVLDAAVERHPALEPVLAVASVLVDGRLCGRADAVGDGVTLEVLPPFAGG